MLHPPLLLLLCISTVLFLLTGLQISGHSDDEVVLGESVTITCSFDLESTSIEWVYGEEVVTMTTGSQLNLTFSPVNDTINNRVYTCRAFTPYGMQEESITIEVQGISELLACNYLIK